MDEKRKADAECRRIFESGIAGDPLIEREGNLGEALPVNHPGGGIAGWMAPITAGPHLLGLIQLTADMGFLRFAGFQNRRGDVFGCPLAADWLNSETILDRVRSEMPDCDWSSEPVLTYDRNVTRLCWEIVGRNRDGGSITIHVEGGRPKVVPDVDAAGDGGLTG